MNRKGQGRKPILSLQNKAHVAKVKSAITRNPQSVKSVVAELEPVLGVNMHPETLKRFKKLGYNFRRVRTCLKSRQVATERETGAGGVFEVLSQLAAVQQIDLYFGDEAGFSMQPCLPPAWLSKNEQIRIFHNAIKS